ncbi:MAG: hypothetical protein KKF41_12765 [Actinobacteria bacterium]|nr:hypothetical protein [Actinomycetota bacterium]MBU1944966.1 hypothetical protein [Actinomycetota bacterium]MBU2688448.1 hypothetical protein [Actinomycetota bacterium]
MAKKKSSRDIKKLLEDAFGEPPGSELGKPLREGAALQATVEGETFSLTKRNGRLVVTEGGLVSPDITVDLNRAACEYMAASDELEEFVSRARECIKRQRDGCYMDYEFNAGYSRLIMRGYLDFARRFGII